MLIKLIRCLVTMLALGVVGLPQSASARLPNVVLFLVDDLGARDLGCYGSEFYETPQVDRLAADGVRFTQAYAACHVCSPTRAGIMTGKSPARVQLTDWLPGRKDFGFQKLKNAPIHDHLPLDEVTLAEALHELGYATGHYGKWHLGEDPYGPLQQGFDVQVPHWNKGWPKKRYFFPFEMEGLDSQPGDYLTDRLTDEALRFVENNKDRPFFLYLSHFAVHDPIQGRPDLVETYRAKLADAPKPAGEAFVLEDNPDAVGPFARSELDTMLHEQAYAGYKVLPHRTVKIKQHQDNVQFAAMVESMDESLGRIRAALRELKLEDQTIVIFASDNGGMSAANFGRPDRVIPEGKLDAAFSTSNLPFRGAKGWLYEGGIRVPLIMLWPGKGRGGTVCDVPVISMDLFPTILEMIGSPARTEQHVDGVSLAGLVKGDPSLDREALYWHFPHYSNHGMQSPGGAIRRGDDKLLEYFENGTVQLFNLRDDPGEQHDLADDQPETVDELRNMLHAWRAQVSAQMMEPNPEYQPVP